MNLCAYAVVFAVAGASQAAHADDCSSTGIYTAKDGSGLDVYVKARMDGSRLAPYGLTVSPFATDAVVTALGHARGVRLGDLSGLDIDYAFDGTGGSIKGQRLKLTAYYPYQRSDVPTLELTIGNKLWASAIGHRDPSIPKLSDVYASFDLMSVGLFHPGETATLRLTTPDGGEVAHATYIMPTQGAFIEGLRLAYKDLQTDCEVGDPFQ